MIPLAPGGPFGSGNTESVCSQLPLRDPLLLSVDDPVFAILGLFRRGGQTSHSASGSTTIDSPNNTQISAAGNLVDELSVCILC